MECREDNKSVRNTSLYEEVASKHRKYLFQDEGHPV